MNLPKNFSSQNKSELWIRVPKLLPIPSLPNWKPCVWSMETTAVVDQGFLIWGPQLLQVFPKNCMKIKKCGPLDPLLHTLYRNVSFCVSERMHFHPQGERRGVQLRSLRRADWLGSTWETRGQPEVRGRRVRTWWRRLLLTHPVPQGRPQQLRLATDSNVK